MVRVGKMPQLVTQYQWSPEEHVHTNNIIWTEQVIAI